MRDIALAVVILGLLPFVLRRPAIGALMWAWVSIMNPHQLTYGFARSIPWAMIIALTTLVALAFSKQRKPLPKSGGVAILLMFMAWMTLSSAFALNPEPAEVWDKWVVMLKIFVMLFVTLMLLRGRKEIEWLIWVIVLSLAYFGVKGGIFTAATGGSYRVWGPPGGMIEGNNELAVALIIAMPFMYYLRGVSAKRWIRLAMLGCMITCAFAALGTQSRGALLAGTAMGLVLGLKGKHPVRSTVALAIVGAGIIAFMPDSWTQRMDTIADYREDNSAMQRIWAWTVLWNAALDRPLVGVGFRADNVAVFSRYGNVPGFEQFSSAYTPTAHSSYLQALGEHGFPGLFLFLSIGVWIWFTAAALARRAANDPELSTWVPLLMKMCQVSVLGFGVGAAFLSLVLFDVPYYILGIVVLVQTAVNEKMAANAGKAIAPIPQTLNGAPNVGIRPPAA